MSTTSYAPTVSPLRSRFLWWLATALWLVMLGFFSTDMFSAEHTKGVLWLIVHFFYPSISMARFDLLHFLVRKTAHFTAYGFLSALAFYSWRTTWLDQARWKVRWAGLALALTLAAASLDEYHQTFVSSRTGSAQDVFLDMVGALCFQLVIAIAAIW
ncbi:MAG TPA: VanZ family protein [Alphaproteobacteria bacterium]|nr:VanZ family protein [Alphaproteobacteria bacterium]